MEFVGYKLHPLHANPQIRPVWFVRMRTLYARLFYQCLHSYAIVSAGMSVTPVAKSPELGTASRDAREPVLVSSVASPPVPITGRVTLFSLERGYGFIKPESGASDVYFLRVNVEKPKGFMRVGDRCRYEVKKTDKGPQVMHIRKINDDGSEDDSAGE